MSRRQPGSLAPLSAKLATSRANTKENSGARGRNRPLPASDGHAAIAAANLRAFPWSSSIRRTLFRRGLGLLVRQWYPAASVFDAGDIGQLLADMGLRRAA